MRRTFGLLTVVATGLFAWYRQRYVEAAEQGDMIMSSARRLWEVIKALGASEPKAADYLTKGEAIISAMEKGWESSNTKTPEIEDYYNELLALAGEVGKALAE